MSDEETRDPVEALAEDFLERLRKGESPTIAEYATSHPDLAAGIEELFPTLLLMERAKRESRPAGPRLTAPALERLGDFRLVREVGRGGMGVVYEAVQESLGRRVALKLLPPEAKLSPRAEERFRREALAAGTLHHTNIVQVFGVGAQDGHRYYVMQFIEGKSLEELIAQGQPVEPRRAARLCAQVAAGLEHAHARGILHRDVKPANVLLDPQDTAWITDFGLAKVVGETDSLTETGDVLGTLRYLPPERLEGKADARGDVYGVGLLLYELLTGQRAFPTGERADLLRAIREVGPRPPATLLPGLDRDLETILLRAIARDPAGRYASAAALQEDLERWLEDRPIAARRAGPVERTWRWCRRNRALAAVTAVAVVSLHVAAAAGWTGYISTEQALERESQRRSEAERATREAEAASRRARENERLSLTALEGIFDALAGERIASSRARGPGGAFTTEQEGEAKLLQTVLEFYDAFAARNQTDPRLQLEAARAHRRVGLLRTRLGEQEAAAEAYTHALERLERVNAAPDRPPGSEQELALTLFEAANVAPPGSAGLAVAEVRARRASELLERLVDAPPPPLLAAPEATTPSPRDPRPAGTTPLGPELVVAARCRHAVTLARLGRAEEALAELTAATEAREALPAQSGDWRQRLLLLGELTLAREAVSEALLGKAQPTAAVDLLEEALNEATAYLGGGRGRSRTMSGLYERHSAAYSALGHPKRAEAMGDRARARRGNERRNGRREPPPPQGSDPAWEPPPPR